jgi:CzcA family heavy metal efflux pump
MLNRIIRFSLANRLLVVSLSALVIVYGLLLVPRLGVDIFPDLNRPVVTIFAEAPGLAPEEVESLVTLPLETLVNGAPNVQRVRSVSSIGLALVFVEFDWNTDIYLDRQIVSERLQLAAGQLPEGVVPTMGPISSLMGEIMLVGLTSRDGSTSPIELRTLADWTIRPRLLGIPGVAQVTAIGGGVAQYQVLVDPNQLLQYGLSLGDVEQAVAGSNRNSTGGYLIDGPREFLVRNLGRVQTASDIQQTVIATRTGVPVTVGDIGRVVVGPQVKRGDAGVNGGPGVILSVQKQPGADTLALTDALDRAFQELGGALPAGVEINRNIFRQGDFIGAAIGNVEEALRDGGIIVAVVLVLFLLNLRTTFITLTAIPLSFLVTAIVMYWAGISVNTMTLGGLAIAIGELVDDAIVDVENVFRRLRENRHAEHPRPVLQVVYEASSEVRNSIVFATIIVVLAFFPLFFLSGIEGRMFAPLGVAYIVSVLASLVVSLTLTPVLCSYLLGAKARLRQEDSPFVRWLKRQDTRLIRLGLRHPWGVIAGALVCFVIALAVFPLMGREFLPPFTEGTITVNVIAEPGISLDASNALGARAERMILSIPGVASTGRRTGRAELDEHAEGVHYSEIDVVIGQTGGHREQVMSAIRERLSTLQSVELNIGQPISHRLDHILSGIQAQIAIKLFGSDLEELRSKAREIQQAIQQVPGVVDVAVEKQTRIPQVQVRLNRAAAARYGLQVGQTNEILETALNGRVVSQAIDEAKRLDLLVRLDDPFRNDLEAFRRLLIDGPDGSKVPLALVADVSIADGPNQILRENAQRRIVVQCNTAGRDLGSVIADVRQVLGNRVSFEPGYFLVYGGQFESQQEATRLIALLSFISIGLMFAVLYGHFRSTRLTLQIMANIPFATIGGVIAIFLSGGTLSVASLVGFITLAGISARNGIMMISHYLHLMKYEGEAFDERMIVRGSLERLVPVLMTALTTGLAMLPFALAGGEPGKEILQPVAVVILGGLLSATLLDQFVTPALFYKFGRPAAVAHQRRTAAAFGPVPPVPAGTAEARS